MFQYRNGEIHISVRNLVEFLFRQGDIRTGASVKANQEAMLEGGRLHRKIQKAQPSSYQSEVSLQVEWEGDGCKLVLEGRADGIDSLPDGNTVIDEIKCVYKDVREIEEAEPLHLAQALCYACMYALQQDKDNMRVQITYCNMETEEIHRIIADYDREFFLVWFKQVEYGFRRWASYYMKFRKQRIESIKKLHFPFSFRKGQKKMTAVAHQTMDKGDTIFFQAPTGTGKTISVLYPAIWQLGKGQVDKIFYLTAKTITRTVAQDTVHLLINQGLCVHETVITAKDRICIQPSAECDPEICPVAKGHYDRINDALFEMLCHETEIVRQTLLDYSSRYQVCPYELSFEAARWSDIIVCDYNYVFDPHVSRTSLLPEGKGRQSLLLVDEAHNLLERARDMYSAVIDRKKVSAMKRFFREKSKGIFRKIQSLDRELSSVYKENVPSEEEKILGRAFMVEHIDGVTFPLLNLLGPLEEYLEDHPHFQEREDVTEFYFDLAHFYGMLEGIDEGYLIYAQGQRRSFSLSLFCVDPSGQIGELMEKSHANIFFSATLLPIRYYRKLLGGDSNWKAYSISSPFPGENRLISVTTDVTSRYTRRNEEMYRHILRYVEITIESMPENTMIFFPSYEMMEEVYRIVKDSTVSITADMVIQSPSMTENEKEDFLGQFLEKKDKPVLGFCVLGSLFSEGIDLQGESLVHVMIVGTGLPKICVEREMIRLYFNKKHENGYDYAYRFPGINKVLQAAGRVIRSPEDIGTILLMDDRFLQRDNLSLLPEEWDSYYQVQANHYKDILDRFRDGLERKDNT